MRLATFEIPTPIGRVTRLGALTGDGLIVDLNSAVELVLAERRDREAARRHAAALVPPDMVGFLEGGTTARELADEAMAHIAQARSMDEPPLGPRGQQLTFAETEVRWLAPVPKPHMIRDGILLTEHYQVGMERLKLASDKQLPEAAKTIPIYWKPSRAALSGHMDPIVWPKYSTELDYEFEVGAYIGRRGVDIKAEDAWDHIAGYTIFQDMGLRDIQPAELSLRMGPQKAKDFNTSKVMGPCLVTIDELPRPDGLAITTRVNGEVWFQGSFDGWAFTFAELIAHVSRDETLEVGDFFGSGPPAYSCGFEIDKWIKPGDVVECEIEGLGTLSNPIVAQA
jgi:2-keto-4-pentenoate hydratase/2-oxohepta-3-ene-1,7-dioic acid hydratase in catechol pathway